MKKIIGYLKDYHQTEFHIAESVIVMFFLGIFIWINYFTSFRMEVLYKTDGSLYSFFVYFIFVSIPFVATIVLISARKNDFRHFKSNGFLIALTLAILSMTVTYWFPWNKEVIAPKLPSELRYIGLKFAWNLRRVLTVLLPIFVFWYFNGKEKGFYGWKSKEFSPWPYLIMLLIVLPGVIWASYQGDFLKTYPSYKAGRAEDYLGVSQFVTTGSYELIYGLDFSMVEFFYRGFLVIGLSRWLGKSAVLPMVVVYCMLHWAKPMAETISSAFGGYILGIIALYSRNIWGGIIAHVGLAYMMDIAAFIQKM